MLFANKCKLKSEYLEFSAFQSAFGPLIERTMLLCWHATLVIGYMFLR